MKKLVFLLTIVSFLTSCKNGVKAPDVSGIQVTLDVERFDRSFFEIDTIRLIEGLNKVQQAHPGFYPLYLENIIGVPADLGAGDPPLQREVQDVLRFFFKGYRPLYDTLMREYTDVKDIDEAVKQGLRYVRYYFPKYELPKKLTIYIGPFDAPGAALTKSGMAIGLQLFAGDDFSFYRSDQGRALFPEYISRRFKRAYIPANCMKLLVEDICADTTPGTPLIDQLVRRGREAWLLDQFLPYTADSLKLGYTANQLKWCEANEGLIWSYLLRNVDLQSIEPNLINNFLGEGPFTAGLDQENSPGNIGTWIGRQIVRAYMEKFPKTTAAELIRMSPDKILEAAAYKPR